MVAPPPDQQGKWGGIKGRKILDFILKRLSHDMDLAFDDMYGWF
jgi:hypothetical protein